MYQSLLECQFDRHQKSQIIGVCVHKQCQNRKPFCVGCQYQFHSNHLNDLKSFDDLKDWVSQNSQTAADLTTYLNELIDLVKQISQLIEATQYANQHLNFNQMSYTVLENSINNLTNLWDCQNKVYQLLHETFSTKTRNQIKLQCSFYFLQQKTNYNVQINQQQMQFNPNVAIKQNEKQITEGLQNALKFKNIQPILDEGNSNSSRPCRQPHREYNKLSQSSQFQKNQLNSANQSTSPHRNQVQNAIKFPKQINKAKNLAEK